MVNLNHSYIRVKRKNQIFFIHTSPSDTFGYIKSEIAIAMGGEDVIAPKNMRLYIDVAASSSSIAATKKDDDGGGEQAVIGNNLCVTFANDGVADSWEEIDIIKP